jgi:aubergine-like protein
VDFEPEEDSVIRRKGLLRSAAGQLGGYIFEGTLLYSKENLGECLTLKAIRDHDKAEVTIKIRMVLEVAPEDGMYVVFFNLIMRKCLYGMKLKLMGRNFFDPSATIKVSTHRLELWPGFVT